MCDHDCKEYRDKDHPIKGRWQINEWSFDRCPLVGIEQEYVDWIIAYKMFKSGFLPNNGGWLQQTNKFIQFMTYIDSEVSNKGEANGR